MLTRSAEEHRTRLRSVAYRLLGTYEEADEALRAAAARSADADTREADRDAVARVCLERLHLRESRHGREDPADRAAAHPDAARHRPDGPEEPEAAALDALPPTERVVFVLHDAFAVPYEEIAPVVDLTPAGARQLVARARRRVEGTEELPVPDGLDGPDLRPLEGDDRHHR
ncbi:sigma factor-like helix-turn-helix DNA-binding protein [Streptomyces roseoviridis]|uniref:Sigma factor-like helix-turn-helix DNA-binding protein n=1 Tax=Streptomyces roseoviridis TaxID=67361 RepID=A0ABV5QM45_9ACTN